MNYPVVFVTGSSRGIGRAIAIRFAQSKQSKFQIAINCAHQKEELEQVKKELEELGAVCGIYFGDLSNYQEACRIFSEIQSELGNISILVNNAGIAGIELFQNMSYENYHHIIETNLLSTMNCSHLAIPSMIQAHSGKIINISSIWGNVGASCEVAYSASKGGINSFTKALGKELAPSNIQVNAIACGVIETQMNHCLSSEEKQALTQEIPAGRFGTPLEVAELVFQLANNHSYLNGQILTLDGAWT